MRGSRRRTTSTAATAVNGNRKAAGHQVRPATSQSGPEASSVRAAIHTPQRSSWPTSQVSSSIRSSTSPTACSVRSASGWRHGGVEEVGAEPALGAVDDRRPDGLGDGVDHRRPHHAHGEGDQERTRCVLGQPAGRHRAQGGADGPEERHAEAQIGQRLTQPAPVDRHAGLLGGRGNGPGRSGLRGMVDLVDLCRAHPSHSRSDHRRRPPVFAPPAIVA